MLLQVDLARIKWERLGASSGLAFLCRQLAYAETRGRGPNPSGQTSQLRASRCQEPLKPKEAKPKLEKAEVGSQLFKADLLTFWFSLLNLFLVEVLKG